MVEVIACSCGVRQGSVNVEKAQLLLPRCWSLYRLCGLREELDFKKAKCSHSGWIGSELNPLSLTFMAPRPVVLDNLTTQAHIHLFYRPTLRDSWAMTLDPQSDQNHYPMKLLVLTAICKELFYWLPNPNINVLLLSNLGWVYSMNWKESALWKSCCLPWGNECVAAFILQPGHGCVYHAKRHQMGHFISYSSIYWEQMSLLLPVFKRKKVLSIMCPSHWGST